VQIDLDKPVVGKVWLKGHWYKVEYEGLHRICSCCRFYGHLAHNYPKVVLVDDHNIAQSHVPINKGKEKQFATTSTMVRVGSTSHAVTNLNIYIQ